MRRCPGMDPSHFRHEDIKIQLCISCGGEIEFWKDDIFIACQKCQTRNTNSNLQNTCLGWCKEAARCIGNQDIHEWMREHMQQS